MIAPVQLQKLFGSYVNIPALTVSIHLQMSILLVNACSRAALPFNPALAPPTPHILFILVDDLGFGDVGYHGSWIQTPVIDKLARNGVILDNYYVQPLCTPSRSQLMTGKYQIHTGLQHGKFSNSQPTGLPLNHVTLAEKLKEAGYSTHLVGKWHLGFYQKEYLPTYRGFDTFYGSYGGSCGHYDHMKCAADTLSCGYDFHDDQGTNLTTAFDAGGKYSTAIITKRAVDIIYNHNPEKPLFLFVSFQAVHSPLQVPLKYEKLYFHIPEWKKRLYAGMVTGMDDAVGRIVSAFRGANLWRNTVLVFSTDNGGSEGVGSNLPLYGGKGSLWEGGIRGVGFVTSQLLQEKEFVYRGLIHISDWFPTLINLANVTVSSADPIDGFDMWGSISTRSKSPRKEILHNIDPLSQPRGRRVWKDGFNSRLKSALRVGPWKIITGNPGLLQLSYRVYPTDQNVWLFNIRRDPMERRDLSRLYPGKVYDLLQRLAVHQATAVPVQYPDVDMLSDPQLRDGVWGPWMASVEGQEGSGGSGDSDQVKSLKMF